MNSLRRFQVTPQWMSRALKTGKKYCKYCKCEIYEGMTIVTKKGAGYKSLHCENCAWKLGII